jgi:Trk K+ transport system NAD-binding subunit
MDDLGVKPEDIKGIEDINKLPFTTKEDLRDNYPFGLLAVPQKDIVRVQGTSGTTGKLTLASYTQKDVDVWSECVARALTMAGLTEEDRLHVCYGYGLFTGGLGAHYGVENLGATVIPTSTGSTEKHIRLLKDLKISGICCTPSYALYLAETLEKVLVINGDGRNSDLLLEEDVNKYDAFVAVTSNSETNILSCVAAKKMGVSKTIAEVENIEYIKLAEGMGVDAVINKKLSTAGRIFRFTLSNKVRSIKCLNGSDAEVLEFIVNPNSAITKGPLKELHFPKEAIIGGVIRGNEIFVATDETVIKPYDRVAVFALPQVLSKVNKFFI